MRAACRRAVSTGRQADTLTDATQSRACHIQMPLLPARIPHFLLLALSSSPENLPLLTYPSTYMRSVMIITEYAERVHRTERELDH